MRVAFDFRADEWKEFVTAFVRRPKAAATLLMSDAAYEQCFDELASREPEFACVLLGPVGHRSVTHIVPDTTGEGTPTEFRIGARRINEILRQHVPLGLEAKGFAHSHPSGCDRLSGGDLTYVRRLFANPKNDITEIHMPIVVDGRFLPFAVRRDRPGRVLESELVLF
jgi:proteasome lid subunit RPN8/RPN11